MLKLSETLLYVNNEELLIIIPCINQMNMHLINDNNNLFKFKNKPVIFILKSTPPVPKVQTIKRRDFC